MAKTRRWNLNEREGRYAATNLSETRIDLHLGFKRANGRTVPCSAPVGVISRC